MTRTWSFFSTLIVILSLMLLLAAPGAYAQQPVSFDLPDLNGQPGCPCTLGGLCICDTNQCYCAAYKQALDQKKPLVLGVDVNPPKGNWLAARVKAAMVGYTPGQVVITRPAGSSLVVKAKMTGATAEAVQTVLTDPAPAQTRVTYYDSTPTYSVPAYSYRAGGLFGGGLFGGGCAGVGAGGCSGAGCSGAGLTYFVR